MLTVGRQCEEKGQVFFGMGDVFYFWGNCIDNRPQMATVGNSAREFQLFITNCGHTHRNSSV